MSGMRKGHSGGGGHGGAWVISFADLMALLMAFFVMLLSFSVQDTEKMNMAAGSVQNALGVDSHASQLGMIERLGNPQREFPKHLGPQQTEGGTEFSNVDKQDYEAQGQEANTYSNERTDAERAQLFSLAAASIRQAWQDQPDITKIADNLIIEETEEGIDIIIADQQGRAMFPEGSKYPYEITRKAIAAMAPILQRLPNTMRVTGHTASGAVYPNPRYGEWELSFDRANITRQILEEFGLSPERTIGVLGRGDTEPFFPDDPYLSANQRVAISIIWEQPPVPVDLAP